MKFAHFYCGRSHRFDFDPSVTDFALGFRAAVQQREAAPFLALAEGKVTDFQKAAALEQAARYDQAGAPAIIERIPIDAARKTAQMQHLLATFQAPQVIARFAEEDFANWPFWKRGDGYHARGRAYFITKDAEKAEADLTAALPWTSEPRTRDAIHLALAQNRERHLHDDDAALVAYHAIIDGRQQIGGADQFAALQGIARILTRRGHFDEALAILHRADPDNLQGTWQERILKSIEDVQHARIEGTRP
jgi:tetratricopeptide (TPR) repeat protein